MATFKVERTLMGEGAQISKYDEQGKLLAAIAIPIGRDLLGVCVALNGIGFATMGEDQLRQANDLLRDGTDELPKRNT